MQQMANSMIRGVSNNDVWFVDFGPSNHVTLESGLKTQGI
jgi:hypothetical protein